MHGLQFYFILFFEKKELNMTDRVFILVSFNSKYSLEDIAFPLPDSHHLKYQTTKSTPRGRHLPCDTTYVST